MPQGPFWVKFTYRSRQLKSNPIFMPITGGCQA